MCTKGLYALPVIFLCIQFAVQAHWKYMPVATNLQNYITFLSCMFFDTFNVKCLVVKACSVLFQTDKRKSGNVYNVSCYMHCGSLEMQCPMSDIKRLMLYRI